MDNQTLQKAIKSDLLTITTLKLGIVSARDFYGSIAWMILKLSIAFLSVNMVVRIFLYLTGCSGISLSALSILCTWICGLGASCFIGLAFNQYILFNTLVKGQLKTEAFVKKKCKQLALIYFCIAYPICYMFITSEISPIDEALSFGNRGDSAVSVFISHLGFIQWMSFLPSFIGMSLLASIEIQRLGLGAAFDVIHDCVEKIKNHTSISASMDDRGHD